MLSLKNNYDRVKLACYTTNISMSIVGNMSPLLFLTFRSLYGISYSLLGLLVLINFCTQLTVDLAFSFFSHKFNIPRAVKLTPVLTVSGLLIYALWPFFFADSIYVGLVIGTIVFSASGGFSEVLISPVIASIPSDNPEREMSKLHSIYAWGVVGVIIFGTLFLYAFGPESWQWLALIFMIVPLTAALLFFGATLPELEKPERVSGVLSLMKNKWLWISVAAIFFGGASECTMAQWSSGYLEQALGIPKIWGDIFGVALFSFALGLGRSLYAKRGKNLGRVLFLGTVGAAICYITAAVSSIAIVGLIACALTGFCVSMLWPGNLLASTDRFPTAGVFIYAIMAAGGDLGASVAPQLLGIVTDAVSTSAIGAELALSLGMSADQIGMKMGMLLGALFPLAGIVIQFIIMRSRKKEGRN